MAGVFPAGGKWSDAAILKFHQITSNVACHFEKKPSNESFYLVDLVVPGLGSVGQSLVADGLAVQRAARAASPTASSEGKFDSSSTYTN